MRDSHYMVENNPLTCSSSPEKLNESQNNDISMISQNTLSLSLESGISRLSEEPSVRIAVIMDNYRKLLVQELIHLPMTSCCCFRHLWHGNNWGELGWLGMVKLHLRSSKEPSQSLRKFPVLDALNWDILQNHSVRIASKPSLNHVQ